MTVSSARDNAYLAVCDPSLDMWPLLTMDDESLFDGTIPEKDASLSEL